mgnify:FL=1
MTTNRYFKKLIDARLLPKNSEGLTCCRWCGKGVKPPRRTMCSAECAKEIRIRSSHKFMKQEVYKRDKGICAICNIDTKVIAKNAVKLTPKEKEIYLQNFDIPISRKIWKRKFGGGLWDADHIIPVKNGGGCCGLDNLRTLCIPCHKNITFKQN